MAALKKVAINGIGVKRGALGHELVQSVAIVLHRRAENNSDGIGAV
jgi:hypothetical protein